MYVLTVVMVQVFLLLSVSLLFDVDIFAGASHRCFVLL